ncbi:MAG: hypothetical protein ACREI9_02910 [Nitrospiraceae bacterium]
MAVILIGWLFASGCSLWARSLPPPSAPLKIVVAQVVMDAPITSSTQIHSFDEAPSVETEPTILAQLIEEVELHAQRVLTEYLARHEEFLVIPFAEVRRVRSEMGSPTGPLTDEQIRTLGRLLGADIVLNGRIHDYGRLQWQHWVTGWLLHGSVEVTIVGVATAWNPAAVGGYIAYDLLTDLPLWYGGAYVFGWAFRPVHVEVDAIQLAGCEVTEWDDEDFVVTARKELNEYPPEERKRKEVQLRVHLEQVLKSIAETAGRTLRVTPCSP